MSLVGVTTRDMSWRDEDGRPRFPALPIRPSRIVHDSNEIVDLLVAQRVHSPHPAEVLPCSPADAVAGLPWTTRTSPKLDGARAVPRLGCSGGAAFAGIRSRA